MHEIIHHEGKWTIEHVTGEDACLGGRPDGYYYIWYGPAPKSDNGHRYIYTPSYEEVVEQAAKWGFTPHPDATLGGGRGYRSLRVAPA